MADTLTINVRDIRYSNTVHVRIPIINKTNPCFGYDATEDQIRQLMSIPNYEIRDAATGVIINGHNLQEYFPSGGGGGGGVTPQIVQSMINASIDSTVSDTSTKAVQNAAITNFVNSSIESSTADFKGTYDSKAEMNEVTANQNDYAFLRVLNNDGSVNHYERYKWSNTEVSGSHWLFEYNVNNSSFTAEQWAAINSGIKDTDVSALGGHVNNTNNPHNVTKSQVGLSDVDNTSDADKPISTATQTALNTKFDTAGTGLNKNGTTVSHATPEGAATHAKAFYKFSTDALGHVNGVTEATEAEVDAIDSGITAAKVGQIETNKNNISYIEDKGAKNIIPYPYQKESPYTQNGITFTAADDGVVHVSGTISGGNAYYGLILTASPLKILKDGEQYVLYIKAEGTGQISAVYCTEINGVGVTELAYQYNFGAGEYAIPFTFNESSGSKGEICVIKCGTGYTSPIDMYLSIMICKKSDWDISQTYQPYAMSNVKLTAKEQANENNILLNWGGAKNLTTITGGTTEASGYIINNQPLTLTAGEYVVSFKTSATTGANGVTIYDSNANIVGTTTIVNATGTVYGDITITANSANIYVYATVPETITEFMICTKADWEKSPVYTPYTLPNTTITPVLKECVDNGVKNLLSYTLADIKSYNSNGVSWNGNVCTVGNLIFTINSDMSVTVSGSQGTGSAYLVLAKNVSYPAIRFQGCPAGGGPSKYQLQAYYSSAPTASANDNGTGVSVAANTWSEICITIRPNQTFSNPITFKPMAIPQSLYDAGFTDYQPHALSNAELTTHITPTQLAQLSANGTAEFVASQYNTICLILANNTNHKTASTTLPAIFFSYGFEICAEVDSAQCRALKGTTGNTYTVTVPSGYTVYIYGY